MNKPLPTTLSHREIRENAVLSAFTKLDWDAALAQCPPELKADAKFLARCRAAAEKKGKPRPAGSIYSRTTPTAQRNAMQSLVAREGLDAALKKMPGDLLADARFMATCRGLDEKRDRRLGKIDKVLAHVPERPLLYAPWLGEECVKIARRVNG